MIFCYFYHLHVVGIFRELSVHDELHLSILLHLVLESAHVVAVLCPVLSQSCHLPPAQRSQGCYISMSGEDEEL